MDVIAGRKTQGKITGDILVNGEATELRGMIDQPNLLTKILPLGHEQMAGRVSESSLQ